MYITVYKDSDFLSNLQKNAGKFYLCRPYPGRDPGTLTQFQKKQNSDEQQHATTGTVVFPALVA